MTGLTGLFRRLARRAVGSDAAAGSESRGRVRPRAGLPFEPPAEPFVIDDARSTPEPVAGAPRVAQPEPVIPRVPPLMDFPAAHSHHSAPTAAEEDHPFDRPRPSPVSRTDAGIPSGATPSPGRGPDGHAASSARGGTRTSPEAARRGRPGSSPDAPPPVVATPIPEALLPPIRASRPDPDVRPNVDPPSAWKVEEGPAEVHVHIGRIEVTAVGPPPEPKRRVRKGPEPMSLEDYLSRRRKGEA